MTYKHIVFDIDGTLIDTEYAILHSLQKTLELILNKKMDISKLTFALGIPGENALQKLGVDNISSALELWDENMNDFRDTISIFSDIEVVLKSLVSSGYKLGIVTSKTRVEFENNFIPLGINKYFRTIICADDTDEHKPSPYPLLKYMEMSKANNSELLYIGDSAYDMECARKANVDFALAVWGSSSTEIQANYYLEKPSDLLSIIISN